MAMALDVQSTPSARQAAVPRRILLCYDGSGFADPGEEQTHRRLLEEAVEDLRRGGVEATTVEQVGHPAAATLDAARDGADLVVVGSRHRGLIKRLLFGSVSAEVVVKAPCDVLVVR
jgi:nucleotide-binding universal stress UspA family protein